MATSTLRFYNPGPKLTEMLSYDHPFRIQEDPRNAQPARLQIRAGERDFFEIPASVTVIAEETQTETEAPIPRLYIRMMEQWREMGLVLVEDPPFKTRADDDHVKPNDRAAKEAGDAYHREFLRAKASEWYNIVQQTKAVGGVPMAATGLFKYALTKLHIADPADNIGMIEHERANSADKNDMQKQIEALSRQVSELAGALQAKNTAASAK